MDAVKNWKPTYDLDEVNLSIRNMKIENKILIYNDQK